MGTRTFLAVDLDEPVLDALMEAREKLDDPQAKIRWVARGNMHLTVRFLGDVSDDVLAEVCNRAEAAASRVAPFEFQVKGISCVPPSGRLRMVWANIVDPGGGFAALHQAVTAELAGMGLHEEARPFKPHLTLARVKSIRDASEFRRTASAYADTEFGSQQAGSLVVYSSRLTPSGPIYREMSRAELGG